MLHLFDVWTNVLARGNACRKRQGHPGVGQGNILSVTLSPPSSSFYSQGLLWIFGYSAFSPWPGTNKYKPQNLCRGSVSLSLSLLLFLLWLSLMLAKQRHQHVLAFPGVIYEVVRVEGDAAQTRFTCTRSQCWLCHVFIVEPRRPLQLLVNVSVFVFLSFGCLNHLFQIMLKI